jgi:hypothetical protein
MKDYSVFPQLSFIKKNSFHKKRHKRFTLKNKAFDIKKYYTKLIPFVYKKGFKIKKYYTKSTVFIYYTRKKKIRRRAYFWNIGQKWSRKLKRHLPHQFPIRV